MTRDELKAKLLNGHHKFKLNDVQYHGTLSDAYLPVLDENRVQMRKNTNAPDDELTFFNLIDNVWLTVKIKG